MAYEMDKETARQFCEAIAHSVDRIADGELESIMFEQDAINADGQKLVFFATVDPELWPRMRAAFKAHTANKSERKRIADAFAVPDQLSNQEPGKPS